MNACDTYTHIVFIAKIPEIAFSKYLGAVSLIVLLPEVSNIKYSFQNISSQQYFMLLTSGG